jgi:hypothetical protein
LLSGREDLKNSRIHRHTWQNHRALIRNQLSSDLAGFVPHPAALEATWDMIQDKITNPNGAGLALVLAEIGDLKSLHSSFLQKYVRPDGSSGRRVARWSDMLLGFDFGVAALWRDIRALADSARNFNLQVARMRERNNEWSTVRFKRTQRINSTFLLDQVYLKPKVIVTGKTTQRYTCQAFYSIPEGVGFVPEIFLDSFGLRVNASTFWELIPFSFVFDWFFDLGSVLESFDYTAITHSLEVRNCFASSKTEAVVQSFSTYADPSWTNGSAYTGASMGSCKVKFYDRFFSPPKRIGHSFGLPSTRQLLQAGALVDQFTR